MRQTRSVCALPLSNHHRHATPRCVPRASQLAPLPSPPPPPPFISLEDCCRLSSSLLFRLMFISHIKPAKPSVTLRLCPSPPLQYLLPIQSFHTYLRFSCTPIDKRTPNIKHCALHPGPLPPSLPLPYLRPPPACHATTL